MSEPEWWETARRLHAKGRSLGVIQRICGIKNHKSVRYALSPELRAQETILKRERKQRKRKQEC